jgi:hypothetical protein
MKHALTSLALAFTLAAGAAAAPARAGDLTVVELFTSQGCSSCPPADALLTELSKRQDVLALSIHVDYWDYIGWKDPYGTAAGTERQRAYARQFGLGYVYTPQMAVQGRAQMTGSDREAVLKGIAQDRAMPRMTPTIRGDAAGASAILPASDGGEAADVWAVAFDRHHTTRVERGENGGRTLGYSNVAREFRRIGVWNGQAAEVALPTAEMAAGHDAVAVLVQSQSSGAILGAAELSLTPLKP